MSIEFNCECGKTIRVKEDAAGRKIRCPACDEILRVPDESAEDAAVAVTAAPPKPRRREDEDYEDNDRPRKRRPRDEDDDDDRPRKRRRRRRDDGDDENEFDYARPPRKSMSGLGGNQTNSASAVATLCGGILMMVGAVVWFVLGLLGGIIFFYPPILFVLGIIATFRGGFQLMNGDR